MPPTNFPAWLPALVDRETMVDDVSSVLARTRLLTLTGPGGCGKTSLALQLGKEVLAKYADGVWLVELAALPDPMFLVDAIRQVLPIRNTPGTDTLAALIEFLSSRELLLILDNCEHVLPACTSLVETLLRSCPHLHILATSREVLSSPYETIRPVPPLSLPPLDASSGTPDPMTFAAVQLFCQRALAVAPAFALTDTNAAAVVQICRQLDGIPLAIELAAACLKLLAPEQIAACIAEDSSILAHAPRTAPSRHQTFQATLEWSYRLLTVEEQTLFRHLSVLRGTFTIDAAAAVDSRTNNFLSPRLMRLIDTSLLEVVRREGKARYRLLESLRQFGAEALRKRGEERATFSRYCTWVEHLAVSIDEDAGDATRKQQLDRIEQEIDHVRAVLHGLLDRGQAKRALRLATSLLTFWRQRGHLSEGAQWLASCLSAVPPHMAPLARARCLNALGTLRMWQCLYSQAQTLHQEALAKFEKAGHRAGVALSLFRLGFLAEKQGNYEVATRMLGQSLRLYIELGDEEGTEMVRSRLGVLAFDQGSYTDARACLEQSLRWQCQHQRSGAIASILLNLGIVALEQHDIQQADAYLRESLTINRANNDLLATAYALTYLGWTAMLQENHEHADALFREALGLPDVASENDPQILVRLLAGFAGVAARQGHVERAARLWGAAETARATYGARYLPFQQRRSALAMAEVAERTEPETFRVAWCEGHAMSLADALAYAAVADASLLTAPDLEKADHAHCRPPATTGAQNPLSNERPTAALKILGLGTVEVSSADRILSPTDLTYSKAYELLFFLLGTPACTREQIGLALWPDATPEYLRATFRVVVYHLRRALGSPLWVMREGRYYAFNRSLDHWYDVDEFVTAAGAARQVAPEQAVTLLERARMLYRGDFLSGLRAGDWVARQQEELRRTYLDVLLTLGDHRARGGEVQQALEVFLQAIVHDGYCEEAHRGVIRCYLQLNEPAQARRKYEEYQRMLESEFGIRPTRETRDLLSSLSY